MKFKVGDKARVKTGLGFPNFDGMLVTVTETDRPSMYHYRVETAEGKSIPLFARELEPDALKPLPPAFTLTGTDRKMVPIYNGFLMYFPKAIQEIARLSFMANEQHNPGTPMHWDRSKSGDELDAMLRHSMGAGTIDDDRQRHSTKVAWRALANLEKELEAAQ